MSTVELAEKIEQLDAEDYNMVIALVNRLSNKKDFIDLPKYSKAEIESQLSASVEKSNSGDTKCNIKLDYLRLRKYNTIISFLIYLII